jgi:hypothetical protein
MAGSRQEKLERSQAGIVDRLFFEHPRSLEMSWAGHGSGAVKVGFQLIGAGCAALVHAAIPGLFGETASATVIRIHDHIQKLNAKRDA